MGIIAKVLSVVGIDVKADRGSNDNVTAQHFSSPGDDSLALPGDYCALSGATGTGRQTAVGYRDGKNEGLAAPGEKRIYARDADGAKVGSMWLKSDKTVVIENGLGVINMLPTGDVFINGVKIPADGSDVILATGKSIMLHNHPQGNDSGGSVEQDTGNTIP